MKMSFIRQKDILQIAVPSIISNITVPLLGLVDLSIIGHIGDANAIGAIAVGSMIFNIIYWIFGFLRMGTSGLTAQACGRQDERETCVLLARSTLIALSIGIVIVLLQTPLLHLALWAIPAKDAAGELVSVYYRTCIWGAPAMLCLYGMNGWFIGMQNTRITMYISFIQNIVNIAASIYFVYGRGMSIEGVALGTLVAQYTGLSAAMAFLMFKYRIRRDYIVSGSVISRRELGKFAHVNSDIFLRTLCIVAVNLYFVSTGARFGTEILAANALLMQFFTLFSYVMDGFAYAGEALCGKYRGAGKKKMFGLTVRNLFEWGGAMATAYTLLYMVGGESFLTLLTSDMDVIGTASTYIGWAYAIPLAGAAAFIWDGVFIGTTDTRNMLVSAFISATVFFIIECGCETWMGNHGLWLAFIIYLLLRGGIQTFMFHYHPLFIHNNEDKGN